MLEGDAVTAPKMRRSTLQDGLAWTALGAGLAAICVLPFIADYFVLVLGVAGLIMALWVRSPILCMSPVILAALALLLVSATIPFVFQSPADLMPVGAILLVLVAPGIAAILERSEGVARRPLAFYTLCLAGASLGMFGGAVEFLITGSTRVGLGNNPIHYAALAVLLGFLSLPGLGLTESKWRLVFLFGPAMAIAAALLSGSRGPLLAALLLALVGAVYVLTWFRRDRLIMGTLLLLVLASVGIFLVLDTSGRALSIFDELMNATLGGVGTIDAYRSAMYATAREALFSNPATGLGFGQLSLTVERAYPELIYMHGVPDLHSDVANLTGASGVPGLLAYVLILLAPMTLFRRGRLALNTTLVILTLGMFALGATNTFVGILPQTMLYVTVLGYCISATARAAPSEHI
jgi:O-antigen ligase